jgi:hypothetical protein
MYADPLNDRTTYHGRWAAFVNGFALSPTTSRLPSHHPRTRIDSIRADRRVVFGVATQHYTYSAVSQQQQPIHAQNIATHKKRQEQKHSTE